MKLRRLFTFLLGANDVGVSIFWEGTKKYWYIELILAETRWNNGIACVIACSSTCTETVVILN